MENQKIKEMVSLYNKGYKVREIAHKLGYHHKTISKYLKIKGIKITNPGYTGKTKELIIPENLKTLTRNEKIIALYKCNNGSIQISRILNISKETVLRVLKQNNINRNNSYSIQKTKLKGLTKEINSKYKTKQSIESIAKEYGVREKLISKIIKIKRTTEETLSNIDPNNYSKIIKLYNDGYSSYDIADLFGIKNPDNIWKFLKRRNLIRNKIEVRKLVAQKLSKKSHFKSKIQKKVEEILQSIGIQFQPEFQIDIWNYDIKLKNYNILIEVQGNYWHRLPQRVQRDHKKRKTAESNGYKLLYVWEHQINYDFIKDLIEYHIYHKSEKFDFNEVIITENIKEATQLMQYHYHNSIGQSKLNYIASINNKPIAACIFSNVRRLESAIKQQVTPDQMLELTRFVIHPNYHKKNFASWMISKCIKMIKKNYSIIKKIISFADSTYNHEGTIYKALGWKLDGIIPSDYWYVSPKRSIIKKKSLYNKAIKNGLTEKEYAEKMNLTKVWGHPKTRFIKSF